MTKDGKFSIDDYTGELVKHGINSPLSSVKLDTYSTMQTEEIYINDYILTYFGMHPSTFKYLLIVLKNISPYLTAKEAVDVYNMTDIFYIIRKLTLKDPEMNTFFVKINNKIITEIFAEMDKYNLDLFGINEYAEDEFRLGTSSFNSSIKSVLMTGYCDFIYGCTINGGKDLVTIVRYIDSASYRFMFESKETHIFHMYDIYDMSNIVKLYIDSTYSSEQKGD